MNPMMAAIRKRKSGGDGLMGDHSASHSSSVDNGDGQGKDLHGLVASLSPNEKESLKVILAKDHGMDAQAIAKGAPSAEEHAKIAQASARESQANALDEAQEAEDPGIGEDQSDEIGKSMLDSRHLRGMANDKPKNLGDRVKQSIAAKLKAKGKI